MVNFLLGEDPAYNPERDGSLDKYLEEHDGFSCSPLFRGLEQFELLWNEGYFIPNRSMIRLMRGCIEDEHFLVLEDGRLRGLTNIPAHRGRKGTYHAIEILGVDILPNPAFEAKNLNRKE